MASSMERKIHIDLMPSSDRDNFIRLTRLLIAGGTPIARELFHEYYPPTGLSSSLNSWRPHLESCAKLTQPQKEVLFPTSGIPDSEQFDLTLLFKLLRNMCFNNTPTSGRWDTWPSEKDVSLEDDVTRIQLCRNDIYAHVREKMSLSAEDFEKFWEEISKALCRIASKLENIDRRELEEKIWKLKFSPLTSDETAKYLREIKDTLAEHGETLSRHEGKLNRHDETLASHDKALDRIDAQGTQMEKEMTNLKDKVLENVLSSKISNNSTKIASDNLTQNIHNNFTFNINDPQAVEKCLKMSKQTAVNKPLVESNPDMQAIEALSTVLSSQPPMDRSLSYPAYSPRNVEEARNSIQFPGNHEVASSTFTQPQQTPASQQLRFRNQSLEQSEIDSFGGKLWINGCFSGDTPINQGVSKIAAQHAPPPGFFSDSYSIDLQASSTDPFSNANLFETFSDQLSHESSNISINSLSLFDFDFELPARQHQTGMASFIDAEVFVPGKMWSKKSYSEPNSPGQSRRSSSDSSASAWSLSSAPSLSRFLSSDKNSWSNSPVGAASNSCQMESKSWLMENAPSPESSQLQLPISSMEQNQNDGKVLHIEVSVIRDDPLKKFHLGQLIVKSLNSPAVDGFREYLERTRKLKIVEVDAYESRFCSIGVSASDMMSLENLWRDCMNGDLKQFLKGTVFPRDLRTDIDIRIDGKEYEACCRRLKPEDLLEMRQSALSQSFTNTVRSFDDEMEGRPIRSTEELSSSKKALDQLFLVVCRNGGRMDYTSAVQHLAPNCKDEISKAAQQGKLKDHFRILQNNILQARLDFCQNHGKNGGKCTDTDCPNLHLCPYFLLGGCAFSAKCQRSHDIGDDHANRIFTKASLYELSPDERRVLLKNLSYTTPEICVHYLNNRCTKGNECSYLHVCKYWVLGECPFGKMCRNSHTFKEPSTQRILKDKNLQHLSEEEIKEQIKLQDTQR